MHLRTMVFMLPVSGVGYVLSKPWRNETAHVLQSNHIDKNESRNDDLPINIISLSSASTFGSSFIQTPGTISRILNSLQPDVYTPSGITTTDAVLYSRSIISPFSQKSASIPNGFSTAKSNTYSTFGSPTAVLLATPSLSVSESLNGRGLQSSLEFARGTLASISTIPSSSEGLLDVPLGASSTLPNPSRPSDSLANFPEPPLAARSSIAPNILDIISSVPLPALQAMGSVFVPFSQSTGGSTNAPGVSSRFPGYGEFKLFSESSSSTTSLPAQDDFLEAGSGTGKKTKVHIHAIGASPEPTIALPPQREFLETGSGTGEKTRIHIHTIGVIPEPTTTLPAQDDFLETGSSTGEKTKAQIYSI